MLKRFLLVTVSALAVASATALALRVIAELEGKQLGARLVVLDSSARTAEALAAHLDVGLSEAASKLVASGFALDLRQYETATAFAASSETVPAAVQTRVADLKEKITERITEVRTAESRISAVVVIGETGRVLLSDSPLFPLSARVASPPPAVEGGEKAPLVKGAVQQDEEGVEPSVLPGASAIVAEAFTGRVITSVLLHDGSVLALAGSPVVHKGKLTGAVVIERRVTQLPASSAANAFVVGQGKVILGKAPEGYAAQVKLSDRPFVLVPAAETVPFFAERLAAAAMSVAHPTGKIEAGVWASKFAFGGVGDAVGFVVADVADVYSETTRWQFMTLAVAVLLWVMHAMMLLTLGVRLASGVKRVVGALEIVRQDSSRALVIDEKRLVKPLQRLVRALPSVAPVAAVPTTSGFNVDTPAVGIAVPPDALFVPEPDAAAAQESDAPVSNAADAGAENEVSFAALSESDPVPFAAANQQQVRPGDDDEADVDAAAQTRVAQFVVNADGSVAVADDTSDKTTIMLPGERSPFIGGPFEDSPFATVVMNSGSLSGAPPFSTPRDPAPASTPPEVVEPAGDAAPAAAPDTQSPPRVDPPLAFRVAPKPPPARPIAASSTPPAETGLQEETPVRPALPPTSNTPITATAVVASISTAAKGGGDSEAGYREVYEDFLRVRKEIGESADLPYDKFKKRLEESRAAVVARHRCVDVRFQVYVKSGKTAIKATPII